MNQINNSIKKASRYSWKNFPMPALRGHLTFVKKFSEEEYEKISIGKIPEEMEDKWFIYEEENQLFFHRSWTGFCIFQVYINKTDQEYIVTDVLVNRDKNQYDYHDSVQEIDLLNFLIDNLLLSENSAFPYSTEISVKLRDLYRHSIVGQVEENGITSGRISFTKIFKGILNFFSK